MKKRIVRLGLLLGLLLGLSGCFSKSVDDLYCLPKLPQDYVTLDDQINTARENLSAEYASPKAGSNTAPVQLQDLDGDGHRESVVAFFRANSGERPLKICVFRQKSDKSYEIAYTLDGDGLSVNSVDYMDLDGDGRKEIVVSWQMGTRQYILTPYQFTETEALELAAITYNQGYVGCDLDGDGCRELMVFRADDSLPDNCWAEYYTFEEGQMIKADAAPLSNGIVGDSTIREGSLKDNVPAVYISSRTGDATVTDVFALRGEALTNITRSETTGVSTQTLRYVDISPADINRDGILELPEPVAVPEYQSTAQAPNFWLFRWRQFDVDGRSEVVWTTYHNFNDGWYLAIPERWIGQITISRDDSRNNQGERAVVFSRWRGKQDEQPQEFLRIYRLEGENRELRAGLGSRFVLQRTSRLVYAAELIDGGWESGVDKGSLGARFSISQTEWSNR